jgi:hypothetical protein
MMGTPLLELPSWNNMFETTVSNELLFQHV